MMKKYTLLFLLLTYSFCLHAQPVNNGNIPLSRLYFHESIDATRNKIMKSDKSDDKLFTPTSNESLNHELSNALTSGVDDIKAFIEADTQLDNNSKIKFLRGLNETLLGYLNGSRNDSLHYSELPALLAAYKECIVPERDHESIYAIGIN